MGVSNTGTVAKVRLGSTQRTFEAAVDVVTQAVRTAVHEGHPHLLIDARDAPFASPTLAGRLHMVRLWADAADGRLRIAVVVPKAFIDPERIGVVFAANFGLAGQVFEQEADAVA